MRSFLIGEDKFVPKYCKLFVVVHLNIFMSLTFAV